MRLTSICGLGQVALGPGDVRAADAARARLSDVPDRHDGRGGAGARSRPRGAARSCATAPALGVVPAGDVRAAASCCRAGRARPSTVTRCARPTPTRRPRRCRRSSRSPARSRWAARPSGEVGPGAAMAIPTGGLLPARRRRGRDGRAHDRADAGARRAAARRRARRGRAAAGRGGRAGRRARARPAGRCARRISGCSPRPGVTEIARYAPPARRDRLDGRRGRAAGDRGAAAGAGARRLRAGAGRAGARGGRRAGAARDRPRRRRRSSSACSPSALGRGRRRRRLRRLVGRRARPHGDRRRRGSARSSATASRSSRASRRCWPTAAACR